MEELPRTDRDTFRHRRGGRPAGRQILPAVTMQEMLVALKDVMARSQMFAHHQVQRERLSVRSACRKYSGALGTQAFVEFTQLFRPRRAAWASRLPSPRSSSCCARG